MSPRPNLDDYIPVSERISAFYAKHPEGFIKTEILHDDGTRVVIKAEAFRGVEDEGATGHAEEIRGDGPVNKTSAVENAETSAVGRAIAMLGFEVKKGIASREEVEQAIAEEKRQDAEPTKEQGTDTWDARMRVAIQATGLAKEAKMKLTSYGVERLVQLNSSQAKEFEAWLDETARATVESG